MNYLAHLFLAEPNHNSIVGNFIADFIKGEIPEDLPGKIRSGVILHRKVDQFTDDHPIVRETKSLIDKKFGKYRGIILDVFYDYILATNFSKYSEQSLDDFSEFVFYSFTHNWNYLPKKVKQMAPHMIRKNWMTGYRKIENIKRALYFLALRSARAPDLQDAITDLKAKEADFIRSFDLFFPDLQNFVDDYSEVEK